MTFLSASGTRLCSQVPTFLQAPTTLADAGITNVIIATGFRAQWGFLGADEKIRCDEDAGIATVLSKFDAKSNVPMSMDYPDECPGLFFSGFPWLVSAQSVNLVNFNGDHQLLVKKLL